MRKEINQVMNIETLLENYAIIKKKYALGKESTSDTTKWRQASSGNSHVKTNMTNW